MEKDEAYYNKLGQENEDRKKAEEFVSLLSTYVNRGGSNARKRRYVVEAIMQEHRTLQQLMFSMFMECIAEWATKDKDGRYDGRNEYTVKTCNQIIQNMGGWNGAPFI